MGCHGGGTVEKGELRGERGGRGRDGQGGHCRPPGGTTAS